jgi:hypothetical protein
MLRTTLIALAAAATLGISAAAAAPASGLVITQAAYENGMIEHVWGCHGWGGWGHGWGHHRRWW